MNTGSHFAQLQPGYCQTVNRVRNYNVGICPKIVNDLRTAITKLLIDPETGGIGNLGKILPNGVDCDISGFRHGGVSGGFTPDVPEWFFAIRIQCPSAEFITGPFRILVSVCRYLRCQPGLSGRDPVVSLRAADGSGESSAICIIC